MTIGSNPGDVVASFILDPNAPAIQPGSVGVDVASVVVDSPTSVRVTLTQDVDGPAVLAAMDGDSTNARAVVVEPTGAPREWRVSWASVGGGGGGASSPPVHSVQTSDGAGGFQSSAALTSDGTDLLATMPGTVGLFGKGKVNVASSTNVLTLAGDVEVDVDSGGALALSMVKELLVNAASGAAGDVLTSQGAGLPPVWANPIPPVPFRFNGPFNDQHNGVTPAVVGGMFMPGPGVSLFYSQAVLVDSTVPVQATVQLTDLAGVPLYVWTDIAPASGPRVLSFVGPAVAVPPGYYLIDLATAGGNATLLNVYLEGTP